MKKISVYFTVLAILAFSCQKEISTENGPTPAPVPLLTQAILLKKFIVLDTTQLRPLDTLFIYDYAYDNLNRCTLIKINDFKSARIGFTYNYYNGSDTLITRRRVINQVDFDSVHEYITYTPAGNMLKDSIIEFSSFGNGNLTYNYQINGSKINTVITGFSQPFLLGTYNILKDNSGNIISEIDSSFFYIAGSGYSFHGTSNNVITYDNKPCPFLKLYPQRPVVLDFEHFSGDELGSIYVNIPQKNNPLSYVRTVTPITSGLAEFDNLYQYTYYSNGYPQTVSLKDFLFGDNYKGIFIY
ncbi:MAG: hypothetical protein IPP48_15245 [Chitinophagaceae bacterium]|nr:hypothetical protein [Chitinophagaceae bacterium]